MFGYCNSLENEVERKRVCSLIVSFQQKLVMAITAATNNLPMKKIPRLTTLQVKEKSH
jgi:hypothetical protein